MCKYKSLSDFFDFYLLKRKILFFEWFKYKENIKDVDLLQRLYFEFELGFMKKKFYEFLFYFHKFFCNEYLECVEELDFKLCKGDFMIEIYKDFLREVEGLKLKPYRDTQGILTIGYGRNLESRGINLTEAELMLNRDVNDAIANLLDIFPNFFSMPENLRIVLVSMMFNLGKEKFLSFKKFIEAVKRGNKQAMVYELLNSKRAKQLPDRVEREKYLLLKI